MKSIPLCFLLLLITIKTPSLIAADEPIGISGVYPHLRMWNTDNEAGTGAVVIWQGDLWAITYSPHRPSGSDDKLYRISPDLEQHIFKGSVGGTPANRMIHRESNQLLIGPYLVNAEKNIRVISPEVMLGRLTGNARHLTDPVNKVYYATMEEGLYEVDVNTLEVTCLIQDGHQKGADAPGIRSKLPGYHGKGLYSGQGKLVYSNNGEKSAEARVDPTVDSGALAEWTGSGDWQLVLREQFTEVTGPGGISGNPNPETDPLWAMGWDAKSLLLALLEDQQWHFFRLPKGSHSYDGAHGWNTEWPRIREVGEDHFLATMHGTFWDFPPEFSLKNSAGVAPRSNYLKVIGDFCRWKEHIVLGCDDSAKGEFLNTRPFKAEHGAPLQSNSNFWFITPDELDTFGPAIGRGSVWLRDAVEAESASLPYLFAGYDHRLLHLSHGSDEVVNFTMEVDRDGNGEWTELGQLPVKPGEGVFHTFEEDETGAWIRLRADRSATNVTAHFHYRNEDERSEKNASLFSGLVPVGSKPATTGVMRSLAYDRLGLVAASGPDLDEFTYYEINPSMEIVPVDDPGTAAQLAKNVRQPAGTFTVDEASVLLVEDGKRYRLPHHPAYSESQSQPSEEPEHDLASFLEQSLTRGATVSVSSTHADYSAGFAHDGDINDDSRWIGRDGEESWIEIDFGKPQTIESVWVVSGWKNNEAYAARDFDIETWKDEAWIPLPGGMIRDNRSIEKELRLESAVTTRRLRIRAANEALFRIYEIAAFSEAPDIDTNAIRALGPARVCREVATERDLLNVHGTVYELPARNAQGLAKVRPIATHQLAIQDFCSHNGLLFFTGIDADSEGDHIFRSADGNAAVWAGVIDDLWKMGKPRGKGGPWYKTPVSAGEPSDPYLMTGYDRKSFKIESSKAASIRLEVDVDGTALWAPYDTFELKAGETIEGTFPVGFSAYWVRAVSNSDTVATVQLTYE